MWCFCYLEYNRVGVHVDIKIACNDDLHHCLNKSATLLHNNAFLPCLLLLQVFVYTEWHNEASEWVHLHNESAFIGSALCFLPASIHELPSVEGLANVPSQPCLQKSGYQPGNLITGVSLASFWPSTLLACGRVMKSILVWFCCWHWKSEAPDLRRSKFEYHSQVDN